MTKDYYIGLLIKKRKEQLNAKESEELISWLSASNENRTLASEVEKSWELSRKYELPIELNEKKAFNNILQKIENKNSKHSELKVISLKQKLFKPLMFAASILLISVFAWWLYSSNQNQTIITSNEIENISLPDGSKVWLNKNSKLTFSKIFNKDKRIVKLSGEAFFEVKRDTLSPFIVMTSDALVTVLGTSFNVKANNRKEVDVTVRTGKVKLESIKNRNNVILEPFQKGHLDIETDKLIKVNDKDLNTLVWKRKVLIFNDTPLIDLIKDLEQTYNVKIKLQNSDLNNCPFTGRYSTKKKIENILDDISIILKMKKTVKTSNNKYFLKGGICK